MLSQYQHFSLKYLLYLLSMHLPQTQFKPTPSQDHIRIDCPSCLKKLKCYITPNKNLVRCFVCEYVTSIQDFLKDLNIQDTQDASLLGQIKHLDYIAQEAPIAQIHCSMPKEAISILPLQGNILHKTAFSYLMSRDLTLQDISFYKIHFCTEGRYKNKIVLPCFENNTLVYFVTRDFFLETAKPKLNPSMQEVGIGQGDIVYNIDGVISGEPLCLVEGIFDAIRVNKIVPTVALLGKELTENKYIKILAKKPSRIYVLLDRDTTQKERGKIAKMFIGLIPVSLLALTETKDPGSTSIEELIELFSRGT